MIEYTLKNSYRSKRLRLAVHHDGKVVITAPLYTNPSIIENFINRKIDWIQNKINYFKTFKINKFLIHDTSENYLRQKESARALAHKKVIYFNQFYNFKYNKISIKNQKTCWGSCSKKRNLNFNYKIVLLPEKLADYIIVHEICHLGEFNHSKKFWNLMAQVLPDYRERELELKKVGVIVG